MGSLTETQRSIVVGTLLGDGAMRCKANALLEINHSLHQKDYVDWKFQQLADMVRSGPKPRAGNGSRVAYRFTTLSLPQLTPYFRLFYRGGQKIVPEIDLSPLAMAVWFMDDGCRSRSSAYLNTQQFHLKCQRRLMELLDKQWDIRTTLNRDKSYYRLRIAVESIERFRSIIETHMLPQFMYKLP